MKKIDIVAPVECPTLSPERQLLWDGAAYMERVGKAGPGQCGLGPQGQVCIATSLVKARGGPTEHNKSALEVMGRSIYPKIITEFSDFNDQATVVAAMRQAALS